jgi:hypothetical protein
MSTGSGSNKPAAWKTPNFTKHPNYKDVFDGLNLQETKDMLVLLVIGFCKKWERDQDAYMRWEQEQALVQDTYKVEQAEIKAKFKKKKTVIPSFDPSLIGKEDFIHVPPCVLQAIATKPVPLYHFHTMYMQAYLCSSSTYSSLGNSTLTILEDALGAGGKISLKSKRKTAVPNVPNNLQVTWSNINQIWPIYLVCLKEQGVPLAYIEAWSMLHQSLLHHPHTYRPDGKLIATWYIVMHCQKWFAKVVVNKCVNLATISDMLLSVCRDAIVHKKKEAAITDLTRKLQKINLMLACVTFMFLFRLYANRSIIPFLFFPFPSFLFCSFWQRFLVFLLLWWLFSVYLFFSSGFCFLLFGSGCPPWQWFSLA